MQLRNAITSLACMLVVCTTVDAKSLDLSGYTDASGAITVQYHGDTVDPYFALQALWLARSQGMDISPYALPWARWLAQQYTAAGHLGRYCKKTQAWIWCKAPDADDSSLAYWVYLLRYLTEDERQQIKANVLEARARQDLQQLQDTRLGIYRISPHLTHGLLMDNLEVWSILPTRSLAESIRNTFWDAERGLFRVSTQPEHPHPGQAFYPDTTAQIFPLVVGFPGLPGGHKQHYRRWIAKHRSAWLQHIDHEFPWGLIAIVAWQQGDANTVRCWQHKALPFRHSFFWTVTDEVVAQILPPLTTPLHNLKDCS